MSAKDFKILGKLGEGSYSSVWKVLRLSDNKEYAMKKVKLNALNEKEKENALNEVRILASINSPFIIGYKEAFLEDDSMTLCIVMEFATHGDLYQQIQRHIKNRTFFSEKEIWHCFIQILKALKLLHSKKILHRDLKCANVFLGTDGAVKLGDLNVSKVAKTNLVYTQTGTPYYASPEVWRDQPYDAKSDIWSLGCVMYEMAALKPPFRATDMKGLYNKVQKGVFDPIPSQYTPDLFKAISLCLQTSPSQRPSADQLLKLPIVLKHMKEASTASVQESGHSELLSTIKVPKNMRALRQQLPKSNYNPVNISKEEKEPLQELKSVLQAISSENEVAKQGERISKPKSGISFEKSIERIQPGVKQSAGAENHNYRSPITIQNEKPPLAKKDANIDVSKNEHPELNDERLLKLQKAYLDMQREYLEKAKALSPNIFSPILDSQQLAHIGRGPAPITNKATPSNYIVGNPPSNYHVYQQGVKQENMMPDSKERELKQGKPPLKQGTPNVKQYYDHAQPHAIKKESPTLSQGKASNLGAYDKNGDFYYVSPSTRNKSPMLSHAKQQQQMNYKQGVVRPSWWG